MSQQKITRLPRTFKSCQIFLPYHVLAFSIILASYSFLPHIVSQIFLLVFAFSLLGCNFLVWTLILMSVPGSVIATSQKTGNSAVISSCWSPGIHSWYPLRPHYEISTNNTSPSDTQPHVSSSTGLYHYLSSVQLSLISPTYSDTNLYFIKYCKIYWIL